jgi:CubicO group peptidase (beta-lactamase class C family)
VARLILDGTVVRMRLDRKATSISLLVVIGVRSDGQKLLLAVRSMGGESAEAWRAAALAVVAVLFGALIAQSDARAEPTSGQRGQLINDAVAHNSRCIGLAVAVKSGQTVAMRFFGTTGNNGVPNANTEFEIGFITKTFTTTLLAWADQQGRMSIDDPLEKFAPSPVAQWRGEPIRLGHLADHTSGLPRQMPSLPQRLKPEDVWAFLARYQLTRPPGAQYVYSNIAMNALGLAIESAHQASLDQLYTGPLGMPDTAIQLTPARHARLALGFSENGQRASEFTPRDAMIIVVGVVNSSAAAVRPRAH